LRHPKSVFVLPHIPNPLNMEEKHGPTIRPVVYCTQSSSGTLGGFCVCLARTKSPLTPSTPCDQEVLVVRIDIKTLRTIFLGFIYIAIPGSNELEYSSTTAPPLGCAHKQITVTVLSITPPISQNLPCMYRCLPQAPTLNYRPRKPEDDKEMTRKCPLGNFVHIR